MTHPPIEDQLRRLADLAGISWAQAQEMRVADFGRLLEEKRLEREAERERRRVEVEQVCSNCGHDFIRHCYGKECAVGDAGNYCPCTTWSPA